MIIFYDKFGLVERLKGWFNIFKSITVTIEGQKLYDNLIRYRNIFSKYIHFTEIYLVNIFTYRNIFSKIQDPIMIKALINPSQKDNT